MFVRKGPVIRVAADPEAFAKQLFTSMFENRKLMSQFSCETSRSLHQQLAMLVLKFFEMTFNRERLTSRRPQVPLR